MTMPLFLQISQYLGFICTEVTNIVLLWLIVTRSSSRFGAYKYIMMSYAVFSIGYGIVEILTQPVMHIYGASMVIYADSFLKSEKTVALTLVGIYCATFGLCILLLATHFVYRFFAICRPQNIHHFRGSNLLRIYLVPVLFSLLWFLSVSMLMAPSELKSDYIRNSINETYDEDISQVGYIAVVYYYRSQTGDLVINYLDFSAAVVPTFVMESCIFTMVICGWKTYRKMKSVGGTMSKITKELNKQLFKTSVIQTLVPLCTMFLPVGLLTFLPMLSVGVGKFANAPGLYAGFYPALDALIVIFMIRDFRNTVLCKRVEKKSLSSITPETRYSHYQSADPS